MTSVPIEEKNVLDSSAKDRISDLEATSYNDPGTDILLITSDDRKIRVHSYVLKGHSVVFRDMLSSSCPRKTSEPDTDAIHIDAEYTDIKYILDLIHHPSSTARQEWPLYKRALAICDKYGFELAASAIVGDLHHCALTNAWDVFVVASRYDRAALAREAIPGFETDSTMASATLTDFPSAMCTAPHPRYLLALLRAMALALDEVAKKAEADHEPKSVTRLDSYGRHVTQVETSCSSPHIRLNSTTIWSSVKLFFDQALA